jgi:hypothetical protein
MKRKRLTSQVEHAGMAWLGDIAWPFESAIFDGETRVTHASDTWSVKVFLSEDVGHQNPAVAVCEHPHDSQRVGVVG